MQHKQFCEYHCSFFWAFTKRSQVRTKARQRSALNIDIRQQGIEDFNRQDRFWKMAIRRPETFTNNLLYVIKAAQTWYHFGSGLWAEYWLYIEENMTNNGNEALRAEESFTTSLLSFTMVSVNYKIQLSGKKERAWICWVYPLGLNSANEQFSWMCLQQWLLLWFRKKQSHPTFTSI